MQRQLTSDGITNVNLCAAMSSISPMTDTPASSIFHPAARKSLALARNWRMCNERFPSTSSIFVSSSPNAGMQAHRGPRQSAARVWVSATAYCAQPAAPQCDRSHGSTRRSPPSACRASNAPGRDTPEGSALAANLMAMQAPHSSRETPAPRGDRRPLRPSHHRLDRARVDLHRRPPAQFRARPYQRVDTIW